MTEAEAHRRLKLLGLVGRVDRGGFYLILPTGGMMLARGSSWQDAFARLEALTPARTDPPAEAPVQRDLFDWRAES
jgi:hypothetical protein